MSAATYQDITRFLADAINAASEAGQSVTDQVRIRSAGVLEQSGRVVRVDLSDGSFFFLDPEYLVFVPQVVE